MERPQQEATAAAAAAERTMSLYDACWFHRLVLLPAPPPPATPAQQTKPEREREAQPQPPQLGPPATGGLRHRRTRSDEALEPLRIPGSGHRARLETILSGKDGPVAPPQPLPLPERRRPEARRQAGSGSGSGRHHRRRRRGRSMSELEFEEVKGLRDLGFTFSETEVDAQLASIVPGLLRRKRSHDEEEDSRVTASAPAAVSTVPLPVAATGVAAPTPRRRPYLSEAWDDEEEAVGRMLRDWRIPPAGDATDLKEHLRMWAHTVASAVR